MYIEIKVTLYIYKKGLVNLRHKKLISLIILFNFIKNEIIFKIYIQHVLRLKR